MNACEEIGELLAVLLPHVRRSIEVAQIEATNIIEMLEAEVSSRQAPSVDRVLLRTLQQMPLSALLGLIIARWLSEPCLNKKSKCCAAVWAEHVLLSHEFGT